MISWSEISRCSTPSFARKSSMISCDDRRRARAGACRHNRRSRRPSSGPSGRWRRARRGYSRSGSGRGASRCRRRRGRPSGTAPSACRTRHGRGRSAPGVAPSSSSLVASTWRGISMRLPMKPWQTPATTATFLIFLASCIAVTSTSGAVFAPRTTSSSFMTLAGEKKCRPTHVLRPRGRRRRSRRC